MNKKFGVGTIFLILLMGLVNTAGFVYYSLFKQVPTGINNFLTSGAGIISLLILMINELGGIILLGFRKKSHKKELKWGDVY